MSALENESKPIGRVRAAQRAARTIALATNPCILSIVMLLCLSFTESVRLTTAAGQAAVLVGIFVIFPFIFVYVRSARMSDKKRYRNDPTLFLKRHPLDIIILGIICGPAAWFILKLLDAPISMLETLAALMAVAFLIAVINLFYRVSFHVAAIVTLVYMAVVTWGIGFLILLVALPFIAWAKYTLKEHNPLQMTLGAGLSVAVTALIVYLL